MDRARLLMMLPVLAAASCTPWEEAEQARVSAGPWVCEVQAAAVIAPRWREEPFLPFESRSPGDAESWSWPPLEAFEERFSAYHEHGRALGLVDAVIDCQEVGHRMVCHGDDDRLQLPRRLLLAATELDDDQRLRGVDGDGVGLCRGACAVRDSHYQFEGDGDLCQQHVNVFEDGRMLELEVLAPSSRPRPSALLWSDWVYSRTLAEHAECIDDGSGACFKAGDAAGYLMSRIRVLANSLAPPAWRPHVAPIGYEELIRGPIDLARFFVGLTLRFDAWTLDENGTRLHASLPWRGHGGFEMWRGRADSPVPDALGWAIAEAGVAEQVASRLRDLVLDRKLDRYNRVRAAAVLIGLLSADPALAGERSVEAPRVFRVVEPFQLAAADVVRHADTDGDAWMHTMRDAVSHYLLSSAELGELDATLDWLERRRDGAPVRE